MEKQGKTKSVDQNITEPKTLSCGIGEIEWQAEDWLPGVRVIHVHGVGGVGKSLLCTALKVKQTAAWTPSLVSIGPYSHPHNFANTKSLKNPLPVMKSSSPSDKPVSTVNAMRSPWEAFTESGTFDEALTESDIFDEFDVNYVLHSLDELDCNNFELPFHQMFPVYRKLVEPLDISSYYQHHSTEYLPRGSLENQLFKRHSTPLPWTTRLKIAIGIAKGLAFLHGARKPVIYRDFKASNILLDSDYNAKLSDFGLANDGRRGEDTHVSTRVMGIVKLAEDLAFLHGAKKPVIYRDMKPSNILLDSNYNAKLYDFGWAKDGPEGDGTHVSTGVVGIQGYTAPEHIMTGNMFSQLDNNELHRSYGNVPRDPEFPHDYTYEHSQHIRKDIVQYLSSLVVSIVVSLGIFYNIWSSQLSIFQFQPLHKEHNYRLSIWPSLLGLFGFMVFVCAVAVMNLVGAPLTSMQRAKIIFLAILMHLQSANSIIDVFFVLVGGLFMGWHAFGKKATTK